MIEQLIRTQLTSALNSLYGVSNANIITEPTKDDFEGDFTFVVFPYLKQSKKGPEQTAKEIGDFLIQQMKELLSYNVVKGFLNLSVHPSYWIQYIHSHHADEHFGYSKTLTGKKIWVEYSSPNTNKPLHLGHIRNNLLGYSVARILQANGNEVKMCNLVNDRGIHICKSMLAWIKFGNHETPESSGLKGDHLVGKYYVEFDKQWKVEVKQLIEKGIPEEEAEKQAPLMQEAQEMLRKWEAGDDEVKSIWSMMNSWVYDGFAISYKNLGVCFDKTYYESDTYLLGKAKVQEGMDKKVFYQKDDGSVWVDLTADGLDQKLLLRADGTSVYITQDIGTAELKYEDFAYDRSVYVVGNEQDYHFKVLKLICQKLGKPYADGIYHLSYGMVELPHGKMKSREGTVVDADDLIAEMIQTAEETTKALGKTEGLSETELSELYHTIGMGALKYYLLKVEPRKKMLFNPAESIDFHGNTGPFIQYTYARISSILRNAQTGDIEKNVMPETLLPLEIKLIKTLHQYPQVIADAGEEMSPGLIANQVYEVAKTFSQFYHEISILKESDEAKRAFRLQLATLTGHTIRSGFGLLGIQVPNRM
ncbi:MAG: arginine--tRNA ligase [Bacteroidia bacterium]